MGQLYREDRVPVGRNRLTRFAEVAITVVLLFAVTFF